MGANRPQKVYTLDDGQTITPSELAIKLRLSTPAARCRLEKYSNPTSVFRVVGISRSKRTYKCKAYALSDGTWATARQLSEKYEVSLCTIRNRLSNGITDIEKLKRQPNAKKQHNLGKTKVKVKKTIILDSQKKVSQLIQGRNFFDPMSRLLLKTI
jgi:hypothetical protein